MYLRREDDGREIKSLKDIYKETKIRVACYVGFLENKWVSAARRRENTKQENSTVEEVIKALEYME